MTCLGRSQNSPAKIFWAQHWGADPLGHWLTSSFYRASHGFNAYTGLFGRLPLWCMPCSYQARKVLRPCCVAAYAPRLLSKSAELMHTGTPEADQALFEEILVECTAFQLAGALTEESVQEAVGEVAELVLSRAPGTAGSSASAGSVSGSESAPSLQAARAAVSEAVTSTGMVLSSPALPSDAVA